MSTSRPVNLTATEALSRLNEGNQRYVEGMMTSPNMSVNHRQSLVNGQAPFAIILTCADSRVSPELIFDQGLGDLFVIRVAGNIIDDAILGSIEYASVHLGVNLILVMGHEKCGAVGAAVQGDETQLHIDELIRAIRPAVERAQAQDPSDLVEASVRENAQYVSESLRDMPPVMRDLCAESGVQVVPAYYSLSSGAVELL
jgi:carbonic anhydrase